MLRAKQAQHAQHILVIILVVFLVAMAVNYYAPSQVHLRQEVERLREQVKIERARAGKLDTCPVNIDCQRRLRDLLRNNWVMENDSLRKRIIELEKAIVSGGTCLDISHAECTNIKSKLSTDHEEERRKLESNLFALQQQARLAEQQHNKLVAAPAPANENKKYDDALKQIQESLDFKP